MKRIFTFIIILLIQVNMGWSVNKSSDLFVITDAVESEGFKIEEWENIYIDQLSINEFEKLLERLKKDYTVIKKKNDKVHKLIFSNKKKQNNLLTLEIVAVIPNENKQIVQVTSMIKGNIWNKDVKREMTSMTELLTSKLQLNLEENFACVMINNDDIMEVGLSINNVMENLNVLHKREHVDNLENSIYEQTIYGYSPLIGNELNINDDKTNIQLTMRNMTKQKKQVIIGTPIILNEY